MTLSGRYSIQNTSFNIENGLLGAAYADTSIDLVISQNTVISNFSANLISDVFSAMLLSPSGDLTQLTSVSKPFSVTIPVNQVKAFDISRY